MPLPESKITITVSVCAPGRLSVQFPYDAMWVKLVRRCEGSKWNAAEKRWELPVRHLDTVCSIFNLEKRDLAPEVRREQRAAILQKATQTINISASPVCAKFGSKEYPRELVDNETRYLVPGHEFTPLYKRGHWDGWKCLLNKRSNTFPAGLLPRVQAVLEASGHRVSVSIDDPPGEELPVSRKKSVHALRPYQTECIESAVERQRGVIEIATGGGKTLIATEIIRRLRRRALFLVTTKDLLHQTIRTFSGSLSWSIGQAGDGIINIGDITVATVQTCARALDIKLEPMADGEKFEKDSPASGYEALSALIAEAPVVFFDECHHLPANSVFQLASAMERAHWRFGLSATPYRQDGMDLLIEAALGRKIHSSPASRLIEDGFLVPPTIHYLSVPALRVTGKPEYQEIYQHYVVENPARNQLVAKAARRMVELGRRVLILVNHVRHGELLQEILPGVPLVQGCETSTTRKEIFQSLQDGTLRLAIATTLADEGLDVPALDGLVLAGAGRSPTRAMQRVGRALRLFEGKSSALVVDFDDQAPFLVRHAEARRQIFEAEPAFRVQCNRQQEFTCSDKPSPVEAKKTRKALK